MEKHKIEKLADEVFQAESNYQALSMMNTYCLSHEEKREANKRYVVAETRMIEARQALREEQGL
tara:strand:- start:20727 stop:20918 length:192 start_codon:yes stop_codon:yes gene_type:complete